MLIIPAIDLKDGCVVRFVQGRSNEKIYSRSPVKTAKHWVKSQAKLLHIVDLDGAVSGTLKNLDALKEIINGVSVPIEFGGGVRKIETIRMLLKLGVQRVVLGTKAIEDKVFLKKAFKEFKERIIVSVDAKSGKLLVKGWRSEARSMDLLKFALQLKDMGFRQLIYTDTQKDGTLTGPNIKGAKELLKNTGLNIIASGGISSLDDIYKLKKLESKGLTGVIIGKALYEGKFTLPQAMKMA